MSAFEPSRHRAAPAAAPSTRENEDRSAGGLSIPAAYWQHYGIDAAQPSRGGAPLADPVRGQMERGFGAGFGGVRVHEGGEAAQLGAVAYARGEDLHFAPGEYRPDTVGGREVIAHELAHVVQQRRAGATAVQAKGPLVDGSPSLEAEADQAARQVVLGGRAEVQGAASGIQLMKSGERKQIQKIVDATDEEVAAAEKAVCGERKYTEADMEAVIDHLLDMKKGGASDDNNNNNAKPGKKKEKKKKDKDWRFGEQLMPTEEQFRALLKGNLKQKEIDAEGESLAKISTALGWYRSHMLSDNHTQARQNLNTILAGIEKWRAVAENGDKAILGVIYGALSDLAKDALAKITFDAEKWLAENFNKPVVEDPSAKEPDLSNDGPMSASLVNFLALKCLTAQQPYPQSGEDAQRRLAAKGIAHGNDYVGYNTCFEAQEWAKKKIPDVSNARHDPKETGIGVEHRYNRKDDQIVDGAWKQFFARLPEFARNEEFKQAPNIFMGTWAEFEQMIIRIGGGAGGKQLAEMKVFYGVKDDDGGAKNEN